MRNIIYLILFLLLNSGCIYAGNPRVIYVPQVYVPHSIPTPHKSHEGFVLIKNSSDTLYGNIMLGEEYRKKNCIALTLPKEAKPIYIPNDSLDFVRLFAYDSAMVSTPYTEYRVLDKKNNLWRYFKNTK